MNTKRFTGYSLSFVITLVGMVEGAAINSAIAQSSTGVTVLMAQSSALQGSWRLANMTEPPFPTPMVPSTDLTVEFSGNSLFGSGGCNRFKGSYKTNGKQLTIGPLASTFKACEEGIMRQETTFFKALQAANRYEVSKNGLQIYYKTDQGTGVLRFTSQSVPGLW